MITSIEIRVQAADGSSTYVLAGANEMTIPAVPKSGEPDMSGVWLQVQQTIERLAADATNRALEQAKAWVDIPFDT
jgi:hypothetical protein